MSISWRRTALSVHPPSFPLADTDTVALTFEAGEPIATAAASLTSLSGLTPFPAGLASVEPVGDEVIVTVTGLTRGSAYELAVTFTRANLTSWTRTLVLECVA